MLDVSFREDWTLFRRAYLIMSGSPRMISLLINSQSTDWGPSLHLQNPFTFTIHGHGTPSYSQALPMLKVQDIQHIHTGGGGGQGF